MTFIRSILSALAVVICLTSASIGQNGTAEKAKPTATAKPAVERHQCEATTKKGTQCKHKAIQGEKYCKMHKKMMEKETK